MSMPPSKGGKEEEKRCREGVKKLKEEERKERKDRKEGIDEKSKEYGR